MEGLTAAAVSAVWLGVLTSISPCPLATNIAAVSYLGKQVKTQRGVLLSGLFTLSAGWRPTLPSPRLSWGACWPYRTYRTSCRNT